MYLFYIKGKGIALMFHRLTTDKFNLILIIGVILFIIEIAFFQGGMIIASLFFGGMTYFGWKKFHHLYGKILFWGGAISLFFSIFNMLAIRFFIIVVIILFIFDYMKSKNETDRIVPKPREFQEIILDPIIELKPLFDHKFFDDQKTEDAAYQWRDINIHGAFGNRVIDLSNTVLPHDTAVISIRHLIGNIEIYVPYDVEVSIHHSSIFGRAHIFGKHHWNLMNKTLLYQTENYHQAIPRVKIVTSILSGDIEVKRI